MSKNQIEYSTIKNVVNILAVMCAANDEKIVDLLTGYLWDEEEARSIKAHIDCTCNDTPWVEEYNAFVCSKCKKIS